MKLNVRGLAAMALLTAVVGCTVNTGTGTTPTTGSSTKPASTSPNATSSTSPNGTSSAKPSTMPTTAADGSVALAMDSSDFATAQMLTLPTAAPMAVTVAGVQSKDAFFKVTIPGDKLDGRLNVIVNESNDSWSPGVTFYAADKKQIDVYYASGGTTSPFTATQDVTAGKTYYVKLSADDTASNVSVKFEFMPVNDMTERNDSFETAAMLTSGTAQDVITFAGVDTNDGDDMDYFKIDVPASATKVMVKIMNKSTKEEAQNFGVTLFDSSKAQVDVAYGANDQADFDHTFDVEAAGTYYLKVVGGRNSAVASQMTVTVQ